MYKLHLDDNDLTVDDWTPDVWPVSGALSDRYDAYVANAEALGWQVKTFEEWLSR